MAPSSSPADVVVTWLWSASVAASITLMLPTPPMLALPPPTYIFPLLSVGVDVL